MQFSRAFGTTEKTRRAAEVNAADPQKRYQYLQHQNAQQTRAVLAKVPKGSRVFSRNRNLEQTVQQRELETRRRAEEAELSKLSAAQKMTRNFQPRSQQRIQLEQQQARAEEQAQRQQAVGRAFGSTRDRNQAKQQAMAMEFETPYTWQEYPPPSPPIEFDPEPEPSWADDPMDLDIQECGTRFGE